LLDERDLSNGDGSFQEVPRMQGEHCDGEALSPADTLESQVVEALFASFAAAVRSDAPFQRWWLSEVFPAALSQELRTLPFPVVSLDGVSGKRELHNDQRHYFDAANNARFAACAAVARAFQSPRIVSLIEATTGADLAGTYVRLEYAQDMDGFWLQPHTDLGVKRFTMLIYLSDGVGQADLGTDIYADASTWAARTPFDDNGALVFVPADDTWHGLERRPIAGVRKSVIMNYVTDAWLARDQLAFPTTPVRA
jgi:hypothetical protein